MCSISDKSVLFDVWEILFLVRYLSTTLVFRGFAMLVNNLCDGHNCTPLLYV